MKKENLLGKLESEIMEIIWGKKEASVREVLMCLNRKRKIAYTTPMTVMSRLCDKKILTRKLNSSGAYIYTSVSKNKKEFLDFASKRAVNNIISKFGELAYVQFLNAIEKEDKNNYKGYKKRLKKIK